MRRFRYQVSLILALCCSFGCNRAGDEILVTDEPLDKHGVNYVYDSRAIPEVHVEVSLAQWNTLLKAYDKNSATSEHIKCNVQGQYLPQTPRGQQRTASLRNSSGLASLSLCDQFPQVAQGC